jgi:hypothetical protein
MRSFCLRRAAAGGLLVCLGAVVAGPRPARGDVVIKKSGERFSGLVVGESDSEVILQTHLEALTVRTRIARREIAEIRREAAAEHRYCRIPIHGEIGKEVRAQWVAQGVRDAQAAGANYLVLDIDSPGGQIAEMAKIIDVLAGQTRCRLIAHVHKAHSAAAMIALACPTIIVDSHAEIGSAVPWTPGKDGLPRDVEAKQFAAFVAAAKATADLGHHSALLARGMIEMDLVLSRVGSGAEAQVVEGKPERSVEIKKAGTILCMSTSETVASGLAAGVAEKPGELRKVLGLTDWSPVGETVWAYLTSRPALEKANAELREATRGAAARREEAAATITELDAKLREATRARDEAAGRAGVIPVEMNAELGRIDPRLTGAQHDALAVQIRARYEALYADATNVLGRADNEIKNLQKQRVELMARARE